MVSDKQDRGRTVVQRCLIHDNGGTKSQRPRARKPLWWRYIVYKVLHGRHIAHRYVGFLQSVDCVAGIACILHDHVSTRSVCMDKLSGVPKPQSFLAC